MNLSEITSEHGAFILRARMVDKRDMDDTLLYGFMLHGEFVPASHGVGEWGDLKDGGVTFTGVVARTRTQMNGDMPPQVFGYVKNGAFVALTGGGNDW
jgi:hypothetical protein